MNGWGELITFVFVFGVIGIAQLLLKLRLVSASVSRKIIHIGVAHWWLIAMVFFDSWVFAIIGPVAFILINLASYLFRLFPAMEHEQRSRNLGTIYFPIALSANVMLTWAGSIPIWIGGLGIMIMGYGDGLASVIGERFGRRQIVVFGNRKSAAGTIAMFIASAAVAAVFIIVYGNAATAATVVLAALATGAVATLIEFVTPFGVDNLTVPIITTLLFSVAWG